MTFQAGRHDRQIHLGSFKTKGEAEIRMAWANREYADGRVPDRRRILEQARSTRTVRGVVSEYLASRIDASEGSREAFAHRLRHVTDAFGDRDPASITIRDVQAFVHAAPWAPRTIRGIVGVFAQALDYAGVEPNPCRARHLRMPKFRREIKRLPTREHTALILAELPPKPRAVLDLIVRSGLRIHEAVGLRWADIDEPRGRILVRQSKTAAGRRWVELDELPVRPAGQEDDRLVFAVTDGNVRAAITRACDRAGIPHYSPHDWRHLHASRLLRDGVDPARIAERLGHSHPGVTLATYSHVVPPD